MNPNERILALLRKREYVPLQKDEIISTLGGRKNERATLDQAIEELLRQGEIVRIKKNRLVIPRDANLVTGRIVFRQSGSALLISEAQEGKQAVPPINIQAEDTWVAMHNDRVVVRMEDPPRYPRHRYDRREEDQQYGRVIRILERARETVVGCLQKSKLAHYVIPDDPRIIQDIYVNPPEQTQLHPKPQVGDKVVVRLFEWKQRHLNPEGDIVEVLGRTHEPHAELKGIFRKYNLDAEFPEAVLKDAQKIPDRVRKPDIKGREDLRDVFTFTIDPDDAKDFDDALSVEKLPGGDVRIGVHIADVGAYVKPDSALDKEARRRGNSTYLVGTVIPMLPHKLSNGLCSLVENEDRLTKTVFLTFSRNGKLRDTDFANSVIRSDKRMTYRQAYAMLKEDDLNKIRNLPLPPAHQTGATGRALRELNDEDLKRLQAGVRELWKFASQIRAHRMNTGSLDLDVPETKIFVDEEGYADRLEIIEYDESHQLIEEYMLLANEAVATVLTRNRIPAIFRVHEKPNEEKLNEYREFLATHGIQAGNLSNRQEIKKVLERVKEHPQSHTLRVQFLRSLQRARYMAEPRGHYGLHKKNYTHFTSPIRRYSDLVVHRLFESYLEKFTDARPLSRKSLHYTQAALDNLGDHLTATEQNSTEAERDHVKLKLLEFFERELTKKERTKFAAVISEVRNHGMFVELLDSQAFGLVHISTLRDDLYSLTADRTAIKGRRNKKVYEVGQKIQVVTERVDRFKRQIDFRISEEAEARGADKRQARNRPRSELSKEQPAAKPGGRSSGNRKRSRRR
jgi:ribonuclease R